MKAGKAGLLTSVATVAALASWGCLGTGARRVDAPCREMRGSVAREMLRDSQEIPILDVRSSWPRQLKGAVLIPLPELAGAGRRALALPGRADRGHRGRRGGRAASCELLAGAGFKYVIHVPEGAEGLFAGVRGGLVPEPRTPEAP